jgi:hypothetical protein
MNSLRAKIAELQKLPRSTETDSEIQAYKVALNALYGNLESINSNR